MALPFSKWIEALATPLGERAWLAGQDGGLGLLAPYSEVSAHTVPARSIAIPDRRWKSASSVVALPDIGERRVSGSTLADLDHNRHDGALFARRGSHYNGAHD
jgi:hypothetical protein